MPLKVGKHAITKHSSLVRQSVSFYCFFLDVISDDAQNGDDEKCRNSLCFPTTLVDSYCKT